MADHSLDVVDDVAQFQRAGHAHGDVIFLAAVGGNVARGRWRGENLALVDQRRSHNLRDHKARRQPRIGGKERRQSFVDIGVQQAIDAAFGDAGQIRKRDRRVVEGVGQRRPVKIPTR